MSFLWYTLIDKNSQIEQGDFIPECPIIVPPPSFNIGEEPEVEVKLIDSIILSQSCDLVNNNIDIVLVCPNYSLKTFLDSLPGEQAVNKKVRNKVIENLRKGFMPGYHLLNRFERQLDDYQVVDFRNVYGIHIDALKNICLSLADRVRLLPPYREHLSQAFARYFMRDGLPEDIKIEGY